MSNVLNPSLYQINTRVLLSELSRKLGRRATLLDIGDAYLDRLAELGFDWLWFLGVWQTGPAGREVSRSQTQWQAEYRRVLPDFKPEDVTGSPFAICAYRVHEDFGGNAALEDLRARLQRRGLRLMLDFVPNHTALDHEWVDAHPEYYVIGDDAALDRDPNNYVRLKTQVGTRVFAHGRDPYFPGWPDTVQLNYRAQACREAMAAQLRAVAARCDAVRCDMAMLLLPDVIMRTWGRLALPADGSEPVDAPFWPQAIASVRAQHPQFVFMAEVYWDREWDLQQQGFDYTYDKRLYDRLCSRNPQAVRSHLWADPEFQHKSVRFLENHDEPRAAATFPKPVEEAAAAIAYFVPGMHFFYEGQLEGRRVHVPMHLGRAPDEPVDTELAAMYQRLLRALRSPAVRQGGWRLLASERAWADNPTADDILAFSWDYADKRMLVAVNYGPTQAQCYLRLRWRDLRGRSFRLRDQLTDIVYVRSGDELQDQGLYLDVPAWRAHAFEFEPVRT